MEKTMKSEQIINRIGEIRQNLKDGNCYGERVLFTVAVKKAEGELFQAGLIDYMQGRVEIIGGAEYYAPFKE